MIEETPARRGSETSAEILSVRRVDGVERGPALVLATGERGGSPPPLHEGSEEPPGTDKPLPIFRCPGCPAEGSSPT